MRNININTWISGMKVRVFPWVDRKNIYMHIEYYRPGSSVHHPAWEKSVLINPTDKAYDALENRLNTFVNAVATLKNTSLNMVINVE